MRRVTVVFINNKKPLKFDTNRRNIHSHFFIILVSLFVSPPSPLPTANACIIIIINLTRQHTNTPPTHHHTSPNTPPATPWNYLSNLKSRTACGSTGTCFPRRHVTPRMSCCPSPVSTILDTRPRPFRSFRTPLRPVATRRVERFSIPTVTWIWPVRLGPVGCVWLETG